MQPSRSRRAPSSHPWLWLGYALCLAVAIPWYRDSGVMDPRWLGMPLWGWCAVAGALGMSLLTVFAVIRLWPDEDSSGEQRNAEQRNAEQRNAGEDSSSEQRDD